MKLVIDVLFILQNLTKYASLDMYIELYIMLFVQNDKNHRHLPCIDAVICYQLYIYITRLEPT